MAKVDDGAWRERALAALADPGAPRALTPAWVAAWAPGATGGGASVGAAHDALRAWVQEGWAKKALPGVWLNAACRPAGRLDDLVEWAMSGAVSSLHSVLGSSGAHNNPSVTAFGVVPGGPEPLALGARRSELGDLRFYSLPERFFDASADTGWMARQASRAAFVPEKALLDWIFVGASPVAGLPAPNPADVDLSALDLDKAAAWAQRLGMSPLLASWLARHPEPTEASSRLAAEAPPPIAGKIGRARAASASAPTVRERARARGLAK